MAGAAESAEVAGARRQHGRVDIQNTLRVDMDEEGDKDPDTRTGTLFSNPHSTETKH